jgi:hypothetical protein
MLFSLEGELRIFVEVTIPSVVPQAQLTDKYPAVGIVIPAVFGCIILSSPSKRDGYDRSKTSITYT